MKASDRGRNVKFLGNNFGCVLSKLSNGLTYHYTSSAYDSPVIQVFQVRNVFAKFRRSPPIQLRYINIAICCVAAAAVA